jgi:hypothetical protein
MRAHHTVMHNLIHVILRKLFILCFFSFYVYYIYFYCVYFIYFIDIVQLCVIMGIFYEHNIM